MAAGDVDDRLGSASRLRQLIEEHDDLRDYLSRAPSLPIELACIPFGAGISKDGNTRYVDSRINTIFNGRDLASALATHESTEWALREYAKVGVDYANDPSGHRLANRAELHAVEALGLTWEEYDDFLDPQLKKLEKLPLTPGKVPMDLALYPYEDDDEMLDKIRDAQYNIEPASSRPSPPKVEAADRQEDRSREATKIQRDAFLYLSNPTEIKDFAQCSSCKFWTTEGKCVVLDMPVAAGDTCGFYLAGDLHKPEYEPGYIDPAESDYLAGTQVRCENCYYGGTTCGLYVKLNQALPRMFDLKEEIEALACCNAWTPKS